MCCNYLHDKMSMVTQIRHAKKKNINNFYLPDDMGIVGNEVSSGLLVDEVTDISWIDDSIGRVPSIML